jgi:XTP/dITP diphosphohydrolase
VTTTIVLATRNPGKARDMRHLLGELPIVSLAEVGQEVADVEETGQTFEENAILKARAVNAATGRPALGDDSGLEVDALQGAPGIYSARFALLHGEGQGDEANNRRLLALLRGVPPERRTARFRSVLAFADGDTLLLGSGVCEGIILAAGRGDGGFGYDPLFYCPELGLTFAEATIAEKGRVSHRARAAAALRPALEEHLKSG